MIERKPALAIASISVTAICGLTENSEVTFFEAIMFAALLSSSESERIDRHLQEGLAVLVGGWQLTGADVDLQ